MFIIILGILYFIYDHFIIINALFSPTKLLLYSLRLQQIFKHFTVLNDIQYLLIYEANVTTYFVSTTYFVLPDLFCINF